MIHRNKCRYHPLRIYWKVKNQRNNNPLQINCNSSVEYILVLYSKDGTIVVTQNYTLCTSKDVYFKIGFTHLSQMYIVCVQSGLQSLLTPNLEQLCSQNHSVETPWSLCDIITPLHIHYSSFKVQLAFLF